jgi:hypothetical protein
MQAVHAKNQLIDGLLAPRVFHGASRERVSLSREAKALDGLELPTYNDGWGIRNMR